MLVQAAVLVQAAEAVDGKAGIAVKKKPRDFDARGFCFDDVAFKRAVLPLRLIVGHLTLGTGVSIEIIDVLEMAPGWVHILLHPQAS